MSELSELPVELHVRLLSFVLSDERTRKRWSAILRSVCKLWAQLIPPSILSRVQAIELFGRLSVQIDGRFLYRAAKAHRLDILQWAVSLGHLKMAPTTPHHHLTRRSANWSWFTTAASDNRQHHYRVPWNPLLVSGAIKGQESGDGQRILRTVDYLLGLNLVEPRWIVTKACKRLRSSFFDAMIDRHPDLLRTEPDLVSDLIWTICTSVCKRLSHRAKNKFFCDPSYDVRSIPQIFARFDDATLVSIFSFDDNLEMITLINRAALLIFRHFDHASEMLAKFLRQISSTVRLDCMYAMYITLKRWDPLAYRHSERSLFRATVWTMTGHLSLPAQELFALAGARLSHAHFALIAWCALRSLLAKDAARLLNFPCDEYTRLDWSMLFLDDPRDISTFGFRGIDDAAEWIGLCDTMHASLQTPYVMEWPVIETLQLWAGPLDEIQLVGSEFGTFKLLTLMKYATAETWDHVSSAGWMRYEHISNPNVVDRILARQDWSDPENSDVRCLLRFVRSLFDAWNRVDNEESLNFLRATIRHGFPWYRHRDTVSSWRHQLSEDQTKIKSGTLGVPERTLRLLERHLSDLVLYA